MQIYHKVTFLCDKCDYVNSSKRASWQIYTFLFIALCIVTEEYHTPVWYIKNLCGAIILIQSALDSRNIIILMTSSVCYAV